MASKSLKPILKASQTSPCPLQVQKHAHFPPPELECRRFSGVDYDRTPIIPDQTSAQNMLPRRGCPGRTFYETAVHRHHKHQVTDVITPTSGDHAIPRKLSKKSDDTIKELNYSAFSVSLPIPVPSETSESEDSEGLASPPSEDDTVMPYPVALHLSANNISVDETVTKHHKRLRRTPKTNGEQKTIRHSEHSRAPVQCSEFSMFPQKDSCLGGF